VHFLMTLRGNDLAPAVDMSRKLAETSEMEKAPAPAQPSPSEPR